jgi:hypothetical protein
MSADALRDEVEDLRGGYRQASAYLDRFRDVVAECMGYGDENPGDDQLLATLRAHYGRTGPEPTRWREFVAGAEALRDQIAAAKRDDTRKRP